MRLSEIACALLDAEVVRRGLDDVRMEEALRQHREEAQAVVVACQDLAPINRRLAAFLIDTLGSIVIAALLSLTADYLAADSVAQVLDVACLLLLLGYLVFKDGVTGQSLGKRLLGVRVISMNTGEPCSLPQSLLRNALLFGPGGIDGLLILGQSRRRLGDRAAGTCVVRA